MLTCRGVEAEASLSFSGLSELLAPVLHEAIPLLAPRRRRALEVALLLAEPGEVSPDAHAIGLAVLDVLRTLIHSSRAPVVVAVDDVQWLDPASAGVLQVALRRLRDEPMGVLITMREAPGLSVPIELDRCFDAGRLTRLVVGPLTLGALHHLLKDRLGLDLSRPELVRLHEVTAGNPFFAVELGRELDALQAAVTEGVIEVDDARVRFSHPLHASICCQRAPPWKRRAVHRALAGVVSDIEERARHLALAVEGPDASVASELDVAAGHAADRGATAAGAEPPGTPTPSAKLCTSPRAQDLCTRVAATSSRSGPGDVVHTPGDEWHWHGAAPDHFMSHLSITEGIPTDHGPETAWGAHVSDAEYRGEEQ